MMKSRPQPEGMVVGVRFEDVGKAVSEGIRGTVVFGAVLAGLYFMAAPPAAGATAQATAAEAEMMRRASELNSRCRGGEGDRTEAVCEERDRAVDRANAAGWCFGRRDQVGADHRWHRCGPVSHGSPVAMPDLDPEGKCRREWTTRGALDRTMYRFCLDQEQEAYNALKAVWVSLPGDMRTTCSRQWGGRKGSYAMLAFCVEQQLEAAEEDDLAGGFKR